MLIPPKYFLTPIISQLLQSIEASREVIDSINIPPEIETNIRRSSKLKSSLYSARIEGNPLTLDEIAPSSSDKKKIEIFNILRALNWIIKRGARDITTTNILELHKIVMKSLTDDAGKFRREFGAIYNTAGIAIYLTPPPRQLPSLITKLLKYANSSREPFVPIRACLAHYSFEKIHPFLDGNGRVGRLLIQNVLQKAGYGMKGLLSIEEYLDTHRSEYYRSLEASDKDSTDYLEFMLTAISESAKAIKEEILRKKDSSIQDYLLPRRAEIYNIIKEQKIVNFDTIQRRFLKVNARTLRYDIKKLADQGLIRKLGSTRGVYYEAINLNK